MDEYAARRNEMVRYQLAMRGLRSPVVLDAMRSVPREVFVPPHLRDMAYEDSPLPIAAGQTISQPYIVAYMVDALELEGGEKVLDVGAGSGYAAAVLSRIAGKVCAIELVGELAEGAREALRRLGYDNVEVRQGDGSRGCPEQAPFDAIVVAAGGPNVPESLKRQLKIGGRLVIPTGAERGLQALRRIRRTAEAQFDVEQLADVRFVPLLGEEGWSDDGGAAGAQQRYEVQTRGTPERIVAEACNRFDSPADADVEPLLRRIGEAGVVLIGEASHGTSEFYRMRNRITRELIEHKGFRFVAIEADWPDAARLDHYVRHFEHPPSAWTAFARFPTWMWRNRDVREFVDWLREHNGRADPERRVAIHGLDLYSLYSSIRTVLDYLDDVDPTSAALARERYTCLTEWHPDPATYGRAAYSGKYESCEEDVVRMLVDLSGKQREYAEHDGERFLDAVQNARLVANAERYYRSLYYGADESWNLRDGYMFETLQALREHHAPDNKAVVWAHNSHVGNAAATEMSSRGQTNIGKLCREHYGTNAFSIGFGTNSGTVAAASEWDGPMQTMAVRPAMAGSYERLFHETALPGFLLGLRGEGDAVRDVLARSRLERAIGVIYRPEAEYASHYFKAELPRQFDEYIWIDSTRAVEPIETHELEGVPETYPFGL